MGKCQILFRCEQLVRAYLSRMFFPRKTGTFNPQTEEQIFQIFADSFALNLQASVEGKRVVFVIISVSVDTFRSNFIDVSPSPDNDFRVFTGRWRPFYIDSSSFTE